MPVGLATLDGAVDAVAPPLIIPEEKTVEPLALGAPEWPGGRVEPAGVVVEVVVVMVEVDVVLDVEVEVEVLLVLARVLLVVVVVGLLEVELDVEV